MTVTRGNVYSLIAAQFYRVTSTGIPVGQLDPANLSNNTTSHAYKIEGTTEASLPELTFGSVIIRDGAKWQGTVDTGLESVGDVVITTNAYDATLNKLLTGVNVDTTTITNATISSVGGTKTIPYTIGCILTAQIYSRDSATLGDSDIISFIIPKATGRVTYPNLNQNSGENPSTATITLKLKKSKKQITGAAFGANQGFESNEEFVYSVTAANPYALTVFVQDATEDTYTTGYLPVSSAVASGNTTNQFTVNGTVTAPTSISTSTGDIVLAAAGTAGQIAAAFYQCYSDFRTA